MTIVAVLNTKGGVGKSTLTLNLVVARALAGRDVWLVDGDRQASSMNAIAQRAASCATPTIAAAHYTDGPTLRAQVQQTKGKYDDIVIDAGGRDSTAMRAALMLADTVLIPFLPRSVDLWAMTDMAEIIGEAKSMRDGMRIFAVLNGADPRGSDNDDAAEAVSSYEHITYLNAPVGRRKAFSDAFGSGASVLEWRPRDEKAIAEITRLVDLIFPSN
jgi:chromosome partitioning protein